MQVSSVLMNVLVDARDLIDLVERGCPVSTDRMEAFLRDHNHEFVLSFTNVRELVSTLAINGDFLRVRPWLQYLERIPHLYVRETSIPSRELELAVDAFNGSSAYRDHNVFVRRWDETLMPLPGGRDSEIDQLVNIRLDDIVYWIYRTQPAVFAPLDRYLRALQMQFEADRRALQVGQAEAEEHFARVVRRHSATHRIELPAGREHEFAEWIYESPTRCPGLQLNHGIYRALMENLNDVPESADFSDLAHTYALPYVHSATLDRRLRHYCRIASDRIVARGGITNYRERIYDNLGTFAGKNS